MNHPWGPSFSLDPQAIVWFAYSVATSHKNLWYDNYFDTWNKREKERQNFGKKVKLVFIKQRLNFTVRAKKSRVC